MRTLAAVLLLAMLAACAKPPDKLVLKPTRYENIAGWAADNQQEALAAFVKSCEAFDRANDTGANGTGLLLSPVVVWKTVCRKAEWVPPTDAPEARAFFEQEFVPFKAFNNGNPAGLFTGYYEPLLNGSLSQHRPYMFPVYGPPPAGTPPYTRAQIDLGVLNGQAPVLAYVDDPVALFFLHIQGSGRIRLEDRQVLHVGYAGANGYHYTSIGKVLADKGILKKEDITMPVLRRWLRDHPSDMWTVMWENQSYVFFRVLSGDALGAQQVPLTPWRSLAVDKRFVPLGTPVFLDTMLPPTPLSVPEITRHLMIAQDTGGAIRGPLRGDIFFGSGDMAEQLAGAMKSGGQATFLVPRELAEFLLKPKP